MSTVRTTTWTLVTLALLLVPQASAEPPAEGSYTQAELAALDRALEAANLDRESLTFRKDLAKGHAALELVHEMLRDPLAIAPAIDTFVDDAKAARPFMRRWGR